MYKYVNMIYTYIYIHTYLHTYIYIYIYTYKQHICACAYVYMYAYLCIHARTHVFISCARLYIYPRSTVPTMDRPAVLREVETGLEDEQPPKSRPGPWGNSLGKSTVDSKKVGTWMHGVPLKSPVGGYRAILGYVGTWM